MLDLKVTTWKDLKNNVITVSNTKIEVQKIAQNTWTNLEKGSILKQLLELCGVNSAEVSFVTSSITISEDSNNDNALQISCAFTGATDLDENYIQGTMDCSKGYIYFKTANGASNYGLIKYEDNTFKINLEERKTFTFYFGYISITADEHELYLWKGKSLRTLAEKQLNYLKDSVKIVDYIHQPGKANSDYGVSSVVDDAVSNNNVEIPVGVLNNLASIKQIENYTVNNTKGFQVFTFKGNEKNTLETELSGQYCFNGGTKFWPTQESTNNIEYWANNPHIYPEIVYNDWESINANSNDVKLNWSLLSDDQRSLKVGEGKEYIVNKNDIVLVIERYCLQTEDHFSPSQGNMFWYPQKIFTHQLTNESSSCKIKSNLLFLLLPKNKSLTQISLSKMYNEDLEQLSPSSMLTSSLYKIQYDNFNMYFKHVSDHASNLTADRGKSYFSIGTYGEFSEDGWTDHCNMCLTCSAEYPVLQWSSLKNSGNSIDYGARQKKQTLDSGDVHTHISDEFFGWLYALFSSYPGIFPNKIGFFGNFEYPKYWVEDDTSWEYSFSMIKDIPTYKSTRYYQSQAYPGLELRMYFQNKASQNGYVIVIWRNGQLVLDAEKNQAK